MKNYAYCTKKGILFCIGALFMLLNSTITNANGLCDDLQIIGQTSVCSYGNFSGQEVVTYKINYKYAGSLFWTITGGKIESTIGALNGSDKYNADKTTLQTFAGTFPWEGDTNPGREITVMWTAATGSIQLHGENLGISGSFCGPKNASLNVSYTPPIPNFSLISSAGTNLPCTQGTTIGGAPWIGAPISIGSYQNYTWTATGANIASNWGTGIYIDKFTTAGAVIVTATLKNFCGSKSSSIVLNTSPPSVGNVTQNGNPVGNVVPDCEGNFNLQMNTWVSNSAYYTWELPDSYNSQTGEYYTVVQKGINLRNVTGTLSSGALTDFMGKVTVTGVCGAPQVKTFVIKALQAPTIDNFILSCSNTVTLHATNPNGTSCNWWSSNGGSFSAMTCGSAVFTAPGAGEYTIWLGTNGPGGCYSQLSTIVKIQGNASGGTAGWASGILSDIRETPGSNMAVNNGKVYFAGRDGKLNFYAFDNGASKWILNTIPGVSNAKIPAIGTFTKVATASVGGNNYLYYVDNVNVLQKINLTTYVVAEGVTYASGKKVKDFAVNSVGDGFIHDILNVITTLSSDDPLDVISATSLKVAVNATTLIYNKNNTLYTTTSGQLTSVGDIYPSSDVVYFNNFAYFIKGAFGIANLWRVDVNSLAAEQITYSGNLTGVFSINPTTGTLYYGVKSATAAYATGTSGTFNRGEIYQARLIGSTWTYIKTTQGNNFEASDNYIHGPVFDGNHLFYVGAGNSATGRNIEVWNLYFETACTPSVFRKGAVDNAAQGESATSNFSIYPNPFEQELTLVLGTIEGEVLVELYNNAGQLVLTKTIKEDATLNTAQLSPGLYALIVKQNGIVIQRQKLAHK